MNFSAIAEKSLIGKVLRFPLRFLPAQLCLPVLQGILRGKYWIVGSSVHGCWIGSYEFEQQRILTEQIKPGMVFFDIGAHVGFYTLLASNRVSSNGRVVAFEPLPRNLKYLYQHLRLNRIENVQVIEAAVTDSNGSIEFEEHASSSMSRITPGGSLQVKTVSIDMLLSHGMIPAPACMKIDVEGAELQVLKGAAETLRRYHPTLVLSTHGSWLHQQSTLYLKDTGYRVISIQSDVLLATCDV